MGDEVGDVANLRLKKKFKLLACRNTDDALLPSTVAVTNFMSYAAALERALSE